MTTISFLTTLWMFLLPLFSILVPVWLGQRYGRYANKKLGEIKEGPISSAVAATLGLFAFMLAFTFQIVGDRYDRRKELLLQEVSDIRAAYLYAGLVPEPIRSEARKMIVDYVDLRVALARGQSTFEEGKQRSDQILDSLWAFSEALAAQDRSSESYALFASSVGSLVSLFNERIIVTIQYRLPSTILYVLSFVAFFSMLTLGFQFGISGKVSSGFSILLAISFAAVMWLIFALDHPEAGLIQINRTPLYTLQEQLHQR